MKAIFKLALVVAVCSLGFQLVAVASNKANTDKIKDSIDNVFGNNNNNNNNENKPDTPSTGETPVKPSEALKYSNLTIQENEPEDKSTIWLKTNNNITDIEKRDNLKFNSIDNLSIEQKFDLYNVQDFNFDSANNDVGFIANDSLYSITNYTLKKYNGERIINLLDLSSYLNFSNYYSCYCYDNGFVYVFVSNSTTSNFILTINLNTLNVEKNLIGGESFSSYWSTEKVLKKVDNKIFIYIPAYNSWYYINLNDYSLNIISKYTGSRLLYTIDFLDYYDEFMYFRIKDSNKYFKFNIETYEILEILTYNIDNKNSLVINHNDFNYEFTYKSFVNASNPTRKKFLILNVYNLNFEFLYSKKLFEIDFSDNLYLGNMISLINIEQNNEKTFINLYMNFSSNKGIYKIGIDRDDLSKNKLIITDSLYPVYTNSTTTYIKINDLFSYKLYDPKFYVGDENDKLKEVYAYKYDTSSSSWQLI